MSAPPLHMTLSLSLATGHRDDLLPTQPDQMPLILEGSYEGGEEKKHINLLRLYKHCCDMLSCAGHLHPIIMETDRLNIWKIRRVCYTLCWRKAKYCVIFISKLIPEESLNLSNLVSFLHLWLTNRHHLFGYLPFSLVESSGFPAITRDVSRCIYN